jgi:hypothetical protein
LPSITLCYWQEQQVGRKRPQGQLGIQVAQFGKPTAGSAMSSTTQVIRTVIVGVNPLVSV